MRKLIVLIGAPASGKSTFSNAFVNACRTSGDALGDGIAVLSLDTFRHLMCPVQHDIDGNSVLLSGANRQLYFQAYDAAVDAHIQAGTTLIIDNTNVKLSDFKKTVDKAKAFGYDIVYIKFNIPLEELVRRDSSRAGSHVVGRDVIAGMLDKMNNLKLPPNANVMEVNENTDIGLLVKVLLSDGGMLSTNVRIETNGADDVVFVGDVHSADAKLGQLADELVSDGRRHLVVFCGDLFDRGGNAVETARSIERICEDFETVFIEGNHDEHLRRFAHRIFTDGRLHETRDTYEMLCAYGFAKFVDALVSRFVPCAVIDIAGSSYVASHGGLCRALAETIATSGNVPPSMTANDFIYGSSDRTRVYGLPRPSDYSSKTINSLSGSTDEGCSVIQVHGHRNAEPEPALRTARFVNGVWCLESGVDCGGPLSALFVDCENGETRLREYLD